MFEYKRFFFLAIFVVTGLVHAKDLPNFTDLAEESSPAVVNITSTKTVDNRNSYQLTGLCYISYKGGNQFT